MLNTEEKVLDKLKVEKIDEIDEKKTKKLMKIAKKIPTEVMASIVEKLPDSKQFCLQLTQGLFSICDIVLKENKEVYLKTIKPYEIVLEDLNNKQKNRELTNEEIVQLIEVSNGLEDAAKKYRGTFLKTFGIFAATVGSIVCVVLFNSKTENK